MAVEPDEASGRRRRTALPVVEALVAVGLCVVAVIEIITTPGWPTPVALTLIIAAAITLPTGLMSLRPEVATATVLGAALVQALLWRTPMSVAELLALIITLFQGAVRAGRARPALAATAVVAGVLVVFRSEDVSAFTDYLFFAVVLGAPLLAGLLVRAHLAAAAAQRLRERWALERRRALAELAVRDERARIARELHDVIAHALSVVIVQAVGGRTVLATDPQAAQAAFGVITTTSTRALTEMQRLLGVLRATAQPDPAAPSLDRLGELVELAGSAGLPTTLTVTGRPVPLTAGVELSAYRIVQEALTNAVRYAGSATARVDVEYFGVDRPDVQYTDVQYTDGVRLRVSNGAGAGQAVAVLPSGGNGLIGMAERAALCGGRLSAGPVAGGGFAVEAVLPGGAA